MDTKQLPLQVRVEVLEVLVRVLARGILQHEYSKDLNRGRTKAVCLQLANERDLVAAIVTLAEGNEGWDELLGRMGIEPAQRREDSSK